MMLWVPLAVALLAGQREEGLAHLNAGRLREAIASLEAAVSADPSDPIAHDALGAALAQTGAVSRAQEHFRAAIRLRPEFAEAHFHLGLTLTGAEAIKEYTEAVRLRPGFVQARYLLAGNCQKMGDQDGAIAMLKNIATGAPNFAEARYNLGLALQAKKDVIGAVEQLTAAARFEPGNAQYQLALGIALVEQQKYADGLAALKRAAAIAPLHPEVQYNVGLATATGGAEEEAVAIFRRALKLKPEHGDARRALGVALMHLGRLDEAIDELRQLAGDAEAANNLGQAFLRKGDPASAVEALERAVRINPNLIKAHSGLAQAYLRAGRKEDSRRAAARAAELTAQERALGRTMVLVDTARQHLAAGRRKDAAAQLQEALRLTPGFEDAEFMLGMALEGEESIRAFRRVLELNPVRAEAHYRIAQMLEKAGDKAGAAAEMESAAKKAPCSYGPASATGR